MNNFAIIFIFIISVYAAYTGGKEAGKDEGKREEREQNSKFRREHSKSNLSDL